MKQISIPGTDLSLSPIIMGGVPLCTRDPDEAFALLDLYLELGGNVIDSANVYGKWIPPGENLCDRNLGRWLAARGVRDRVVVATKGGHPPLDQLSRWRLSRSEVAADLDESLRALGIDRVDLYYLHRDDPSIGVDEIIDYLNEFVRDGKIRAFGCSNWTPQRIEAANRYADETGRLGFCANQLMWSYIRPEVANYPYPGTVSMATSREFHESSCLPAIAYSSLAKGFLSKLEQSGERRVPESLVSVYGGSENLTRFARAQKLAAERGLRMSEIALGYILSQRFPSFAIVGSHTSEQLRDAIAAARCRLSEDDLAYLDSPIDDHDA